MTQGKKKNLPLKELNKPCHQIHPKYLHYLPTLWAWIYQQPSLDLHGLIYRLKTYSYYLVAKSCQTLLQPPHGLQSTRLLWPWDFPGKNTGTGCHFLLQRIFPTQGSDPHFLYWQVGSLALSHQGSLKTYSATNQMPNEAVIRNNRFFCHISCMPFPWQLLKEIFMEYLFISFCIYSFHVDGMNALSQCPALLLILKLVHMRERRDPSKIQGTLEG